MILYIAGSFGRKPELIEYMKEMQDLGHHITSRWLKNNHEVDFQSDEQALAFAGFGNKFAREDLDDIMSAEGVIFFSSRDHESKGRGGRHTEFGYALGLGMPTFIIGRRECAFHALVPDHFVFQDWIDFTSNLEIAEVAVSIFKSGFRYANDGFFDSTPDVD